MIDWHKRLERASRSERRARTIEHIVWEAIGLLLWLAICVGIAYAMFTAL